MSLIQLASLAGASDAWLFPGQGAQQPGMSLDFAGEFREVEALFDAAHATLGRDLATLLREGNAEELAETENTQPAVYVASLGALKAAAVVGLATRPLCVAGHSLGEYSAVVAAGSLSFEDGLRLVGERSRLMQACSLERPGGLVALLGADLETAAAACAASGAEICNINAPGQVVVGGDSKALERLQDEARNLGIRRAVPLKVSGAFHSTLMTPAAQSLSLFIEKLEFAPPQTVLIGNVTGDVIDNRDEIRRELVFQLDHPLLWEASIRTMIGLGVKRFVEFGPGNVLTGLVKRIDPQVETQNIGSLADLRSVVTS
jgi:[acyl-carrier-protein] S-malonyltransferase